MLILSSLIWGGYSFHKTGFFAYGTKLVSFNSFTLNHAYNDKFNLIYPLLEQLKQTNALLISNIH